MLEMNIDLSEVAAAIETSSTQFQLALHQGLIDAAGYVREVWVSAVSGNQLPGMSRALNDEVYAKSLQTGESMSFPSAYEAIILPVGYATEAQQVETGYGAYDMKPGLLNGKKSRPTADGRGRYNTVPFRHYIPTGNGAGQSAIALRMQMPADIFKQAKRLTRSVVRDDGTMNWGTSLQVDRLPGISWYGNEHQSSMYQGMYKVGDQRNSRYMTFRRVSTYRESIGKNGKVQKDKHGQVKMSGSKPQSWWHPSEPSNQVIQAVYDYCMPQIESQLLSILKNL